MRPSPGAAAALHNPSLKLRPIGGPGVLPSSPAELERSASQDDRAVSVRVVFGEVKRRPAQFRFEASRSSQEAVCTTPVHVEPESLDHDPSKEGVGELPGFRRSKTCSAFALVDGECDSIHFYWNHKARRLQWWRR